MTSVDRTGYWDGDACYPGPFLNVESIVTVSTDLSLLTNGFVFLGYNNFLSNGAINQVELYATTFTFYDINQNPLDTPISFSVGDKIGLRSYRFTETGWYLPAGDSVWQLMGSRPGNAASAPAFRGDIEVYLYADDGPVTISEFRVAEVGELIPQKPVSGSGRNSW
jgi:hypothetical protein